MYVSYTDHHLCPGSASALKSHTGQVYLCGSTYTGWYEHFNIICATPRNTKNCLKAILQDKSNLSLTAVPLSFMLDLGSLQTHTILETGTVFEDRHNVQNKFHLHKISTLLLRSQLRHALSVHDRNSSVCSGHLCSLSVCSYQAVMFFFEKGCVKLRPI